MKKTIILALVSSFFLCGLSASMVYAEAPTYIKDPRKERIADQIEIGRSAWWLALWQSKQGQLPAKKKVKYSITETENSPSASVYSEDNVRKGSKNPSFSN